MSLLMKRWRSLLALGLMTMIMQTAGCSQVVIGGKSASDVFTDPQTLALVNAACAGDIPKIDTLVKQGASVNATGYRDMTVLIWTMECHNHGGAERLLQLGANPNFKMKQSGDMSATWLAAESSDPKWLPMVLAYGGDPNIAGPGGFRSALSVAIEQDRMQNVELLLEHGANVNEHDSGGNSAATDAAELDKFDVVEMLLKQGYDYDLQRLADLVRLKLPPNDPLAASRSKVLQMLAAKGYRPTPRPKGFVVLPPPPNLPPPSSSGGSRP